MDKKKTNSFTKNDLINFHQIYTIKKEKHSRTFINFINLLIFKFLNANVFDT